MSTQLAYIAGLFDGEGSVDYKKRLERKVRQNKKKKYYCWRISLEMSMTHEGIVRWVHKLYEWERFPLMLRINLLHQSLIGKTNGVGDVVIGMLFLLQN